MGFCKCILKFCIKASVALAILGVAIYFVPTCTKFTPTFTSYEIDPVQPKYANLDHCVSLNNADKLFKDKIKGPEVFKIINGELFTGLALGEVVKVLSSGNPVYVTQIGSECEHVWEEHICGRPLSLGYDEQKKLLYVLDAYHGIWTVNLVNGKKQLLVSPNVEINGDKPKLFNSMALDNNGDFYWSDSSKDFNLANGFYTTLADPSGRLMFYNAAKNKSIEVLSNLGFANGIAISPNREFLVVAETMNMRLMKYYIRGPQAGKSEVFVTGLPGFPDNIQVLPDGSGILVGQYAVFDEKNPCLTRSLAKLPVVRKVVAKSLHLLETIIQLINKYIPNPSLDLLDYALGNFHYTTMLLPPKSGLLRIDWNGNIVNCYINSDKSAGQISDAVVFNNKLYLGSPHNDFIATVPIPSDLINSFKASHKVPPVKRVEEKKVEPKHVPETQRKPVEQKPTTPPPKPTTPPPPKPTTPPPKPTTPPPKPTTSPPKPTTPPPKPTTPPPKPTTPSPKPTTPPPKPSTLPSKPSDPVKSADANTIKTEQKSKPVEPVKQQPKPTETKPVTKPVEAKPNVPPKQQIPIKEDIISDTTKPNKETLRVIKKSGPTEIPNPEL